MRHDHRQGATSNTPQDYRWAAHSVRLSICEGDTHRNEAPFIKTISRQTLIQHTRKACISHTQAHTHTCWTQSNGKPASPVNGLGSRHKMARMPSPTTKRCCKSWKVNVSRQVLNPGRWVHRIYANCFGTDTTGKLDTGLRSNATRASCCASDNQRAHQPTLRPTNQ